MATVTWPTDVRWFDGVGTCRCGKPAHGVLRGTGNASYGAVCITCSKQALTFAARARAQAEAAS